jgi:hypothetical protein
MLMFVVMRIWNLYRWTYSSADKDRITIDWRNMPK